MARSTCDVFRQSAHSRVRAAGRGSAREHVAVRRWWLGVVAGGLRARCRGRARCALRVLRRRLGGWPGRVPRNERARKGLGVHGDGRRRARRLLHDRRAASVGLGGAVGSGERWPALYECILLLAPFSGS